MGCVTGQLADALLALGERLEDALIWNPLDLTSADATSTHAWWTAAVTPTERLDREAWN